MKKLMTIALLVFGYSVGWAIEVKLPPITEDTLSNGLVVVAIENHELPIVSMRIIVRGGSSYDPQGKEGLAAFTSNLLRQGTKTRTATQIAEAIDFVGGSLGASADRDAITISCDVLLKHIDVGMDLLADITLNPVFDTTEIERLRQQVLGGIVQSKDDAGSICTKGFNEFLFSNHPYGHPVEGTEKSVETLTRDDIAKFYGDYFRANNAFIVVAGDIKPTDIFKRMRSAFGNWEKGNVPVLQITTPPAPQGYKIYLVDKPDVSQTHIRFGHFGITRQSPDYYPLLLMNYVLGFGGNFISRLNNEVRVKGGMTYGIYTANEWNALPGAFYCDVATENDSTMSAINTALKVMKEITEKEVTDVEFKDAISFYTGYYPMRLETPGQVASEIIKIKLYGLPVSYIQDFNKNIGKVTKADMLRVAKKYIDIDNMVFCIVSNAADVENGLKTLGSVTVKSVDDVQ